MIALIAGALTTMTIASFAKSELSGGPYDGKVRDKATGLPVPGALVVVKWMGSTPSMHTSSLLCYHYEVVTTDGEGRFHVNGWRMSTKVNGDPTWLPYVDPLQVEEVVFKPGYRDPFIPRRARDPMKIELERFEPPKSQTVDSLRLLNYEALCDADIRKKRFAWTRALADEAVSMAQRTELPAKERWALDALLYSAEELQVGEVEARRRQAERIAKERAR